MKVAPRESLALYRVGVFCFMLPDYLAPNLDVVFVGINPGEYSDKVGHYFARPINEFWTALNGSGLVLENLSPKDDNRVTEFGIGLTDVVKRPSKNIDELSDAEFMEGGKILRAKLEPLSPLMVCFVGLQGYRRAFVRKAELGLQPEVWSTSRLFVVPSTSPRNAYYRGQATDWFRHLKTHLDELKKELGRR